MANKTNTEMTVSKIREVAGFNPAEKMINIISLQGEPQKYLEVKWRIEWFLRYCDEYAIDGCIREEKYAYIEAANTFVATSEILMDGKVVATATASKPYIPGTGSPTILQEIFTAATGRALKNLGFGNTSCGVEEAEDIPCDAGIPTIDMRENPLFANILPKEPASSATPTKETEKANNAKPLTLEEAKAVVLEIGSHKGKSMGELFATKPEMIEFYANKFENAKYDIYKRAAQVILGDK